MIDEAPALTLAKAIQDRLVNVAPSYLGEFALATNDAPPRYVWVLTDAQTKAPKGTGNPSAPAPRELFWDWVRFRVHCWNRDDRSTFALRRALLKAIVEVCGAAVQIGRSDYLGSKDINAAGRVWVVELTLPSPVFDGPIGLDDPAGTGTGVAIANDSVFEVPIGVPGDGGLTTGDD